MSELKSSAAISLVLVAVTMALAGCGGVKLLKEPISQPSETALASVQDDRLRIDLEWVIVRDGPGAWSSPADWDEYILSISNKTGESLVIDEITLVDSLGGRVQPEDNRVALVRASKKTAKRYKKADIEVHAGMSGVGLLGTGTAMMLGGTYLGLQAAYGSIAGTAAASAVGWAGVIAAYSAPLVVAGGVVRGVNNSKVNNEIQTRQSAIPYDVPGRDGSTAHMFYPISPSPELIEIRYSDGSGEYSLFLDTRAALEGLHIEASEGLGDVVAGK